jgi:hypothetical protein
MTPALKSRLSAERLFTAEDIAEMAFNAYSAGWLDRAVNGGPNAEAVKEAALESALAKVKTHLTSDTTTIRPRKA